MNRTTFVRLALVVVAIALLPAGCGPSSESGGERDSSSTGPVKPLGEIKTLKFGVISTDSAVDLRKGFEPFLNDMSDAIGMPVEATYASDYSGTIIAMQFDKVHVSWFGNKSALEAVDRAHGEVFAQTVAADGSPGYWSVIITHKDSPHATLDDIIANGKDLSFGDGDPNSTSGHLIPTHYIWAKRNIDPKEHFKIVRSANHQSNLLAVLAKQVDFATNNTENLLTFRKQFPEKAEQIRIIWKSPMIALDPLVRRKDLPDSLKKKIDAFIFSYGVGDTPEAERQRQVLAGMSSGWAPFNRSSNAQLIPVREIMLAGELARVKANKELSAEQRDARIDDIQGKLAQLAAQREAEGER